jgi:hypothetical protein
MGEMTAVLRQPYRIRLGSAKAVWLASPLGTIFRRPAESLYPVGSGDDMMNDRPPEHLPLGRRCTGAWVADGLHHNGLLAGRFLLRGAEHGPGDQRWR